MGSCGSKRRRGPGPALDRIDAAGSLLDYDYYGGLSPGIANRQSFGFGGSGYGNSGFGIANRQSLAGYGSSCPQGVNQNTALLATAAAIAVGAGVLFRAITLQQAGRRRRRDASVQGGDLHNWVLDLFQGGEHHLSFSFLADFGSKSCSAAGVRGRMICESEAAKVRVDAATVSTKWSPAYYYK